MKFSERLRTLRLESKYTQKELAEILGISYQSLQKYERGINKPRLERLEEIAVLFDVSVSYLLGETDVRSPSTLSETILFSKRVKALRINAGYTQAELAKKLGITRGAYTNYGIGTTPSIPRIDRLEQIANVFDVSVSYLIGETDEGPVFKQIEATTFPERLKFLREEAQLSQTKLAGKLKLSSRQVYNNYERGITKPTNETLVKLSKIFNVSVEYLLCETNSRNSSDNQ